MIEDPSCNSCIQSSPVKVLAVIEVPPWYSCIQSSPVKVLAVIEDPSCYSCIQSNPVKLLTVIKVPPCNSCIQSSPVKVLAVIEVPPYYSCIQSSPVKVLAVIEDPSCYSCIQGSRVAQWVRSFDLTAHTSLSPIRRGFAPSFVNYKKGALDLQSQVIKLISCLPRVGGSLRVLTLPPPLKLVTMIKLKYCWKWR